jgi:hypothetical protein
MSGRASAWLHKWCCAVIMSMVKVEEINKAHVYKKRFYSTTFNIQGIDIKRKNRLLKGL